MLKQTKSRKTSSRADLFFRELRQLGSPEQVMQKLDEMPRDELQELLFEGLEAGAPRTRQRVLVELANLHDLGCERFWRKWGPLHPREPEAALLQVRDELRELWHLDTPAEKKQRIIDFWLAQRPAWYPRRDYNPFWTSWRFRRVLLDPRNLRASLAVGAIEQAVHLAYCRNPECVKPYFLARRKSQKYCERGECTVYAQRQYALAWWDKKGKKRREKAQARRRKLQKRKASKRR